MADKKHDFTKTEIKAGLMVLASLAVLALFGAVVLGLRPPKPEKTFYADFVNVKGLHPGADVMFGGLAAGKVREVGLPSDTKSQVRVTFSVDERVPVNSESVASIAQITLTSENHLEISTGSERGELLESGSLVKSQEGGLFDVAGLVAQDVRELMGDVRSLLGVKQRDASKEELVTIADLFQKVETAVGAGTEAVEDVRDIVTENRADVQAIVKKIRDIEDSAHTLVTNLDAVLAENRPDIRASVESVKTATQRVEDATARLNGLADSLQAVLDNAQNLTGDAATFVKKSRPAIEEIILDLRETVWHMKSFARTIQEQPESVIRGATPKGRTP